MKILFIGPVGSGKSTQARLLAKELKVPLVASGAILRELANQDNDQGRVIKEALVRGTLVDDFLVSGIIKKRIEQLEGKGGFIVEGYPRSLKQLEYFNPGFDRVVYLSLSESEIKRRVKQRGRADDANRVIQARLQSYYQQTVPLIQYFKKQGLVIEVSGLGSIEEISQKIKRGITGDSSW